jgi:hypothetical protein
MEHRHFRCRRRVLYGTHLGQRGDMMEFASHSEVFTGVGEIRLKAESDAAKTSGHSSPRGQR